MTAAERVAAGLRVQADELVEVAGGLVAGDVDQVGGLAAARLHLAAARLRRAADELADRRGGGPECRMVASC